MKCCSLSILEAVTQFVIQKFRIFRTRAALLVTGICVALSVPVGLSFGAAMNGGSLMALFGRNLLEVLDMITNTILMPVCALFACLAVGWIIGPREAVKAISPEGDGKAHRLLGLMLKVVTPLLIIVIEIFGIFDLIMPLDDGVRRFSADGCGIVVCAYGILLVCAVIYFAFLKNSDTGNNSDELQVDALEAERVKAGPSRGWYRPE